MHSVLFWTANIQAHDIFILSPEGSRDMVIEVKMSS